MLNRRHLRVKVLQSLYAFFQSGGNDLNKGEKELLFGIDKIFDLYLYQMLLLSEILHIAEFSIEENKIKKLPNPEDLNPNIKFINNRLLKAIQSNSILNKAANDRNISWNEQHEMIRKIYHQIQSSNHYEKYMNKKETSLNEDVDFITDILLDEVCNYDSLHSFYEEMSIYWLDDWEMVNKMLVKTLKAFVENSDTDFKLMPLYKDPEDKVFACELFKKTILNSDDISPMISNRTQNWEIERIALMDILIMKMAITEILKFPEIPVKVTLNEYIELSKMYSTPKSKIFVNGVLDKLVEELYEANKINKFVK
jgi:transcription antitermination protein NusB